MASRRSFEMRGESFSARDTVATEIPNSRAISFIVNGSVSFIAVLSACCCKVIEKLITSTLCKAFLWLVAHANVCTTLITIFLNK